MLLMSDNPARSVGSPTTLLSKYAALLETLLRTGDAAIVVVAAFAGHWLRFGNAAMPAGQLLLLFIAVLCVLLVFPAFGLYRSWRGENVAMQIGRLVSAWLTVQAVLVVVEMVVHPTEDYTKLWSLGWSAWAIPMLCAHRLFVRGLLNAVRKRGMDTRRVVVVGATPAGQKIVNAARSNPWTGLEVQGYIRTPYDQVTIDRCKELGDFDAFIEELKQSPAPDQIWVALPMGAEAMIRQLLEATADVSTTVRLVPDMFGYELINHGVTTLAGVPVITLRGSRIDGHARVLKAIEDRVLAGIILLLISPILAITALAVKLSSPGPILYRQRRVGLDGKEFDMLKFRSMPINNEAAGVQWGNATKKKTTPIGRFIRSTSIDELPQFFNVLKGELSIVGPRPERPMFVEEFKKSIPGYMHKHLVKGGITGWAQVNGWRGDTDLDKRIECDLFYINNWSIWLDLKIILLTPLVVLRGS